MTAADIIGRSVVITLLAYWTYREYKKLPDRPKDEKLLTKSNVVYAIVGFFIGYKR